MYQCLKYYIKIVAIPASKDVYALGGAAALFHFVSCTDTDLSAMANLLSMHTKIPVIYNVSTVCVSFSWIWFNTCIYLVDALLGTPC